MEQMSTVWLNTSRYKYKDKRLMHLHPTRIQCGLAVIVDIINSPNVHVFAIILARYDEYPLQ